MRGANGFPRSVSLASHRKTGVVQPGFFVDDEGTAGCKVLGDHLKGREFFASNGGNQCCEKGVVLGDLLEVVHVLWVGGQIVHQPHAFLRPLVGHDRHVAVFQLGLDPVLDQFEFDRLGQEPISAGVELDDILEGLERVA